MTMKAMKYHTTITPLHINPKGQISNTFPVSSEHKAISEGQY